MGVIGLVTGVTRFADLVAMNTCTFRAMGGYLSWETSIKIGQLFMRGSHGQYIFRRFQLYFKGVMNYIRDVVFSFTRGFAGFFLSLLEFARGQRVRVNVGICVHRHYGGTIFRGTGGILIGILAFFGGRLTMATCTLRLGSGWVLGVYGFKDFSTGARPYTALSIHDLLALVTGRLVARIRVVARGGCLQGVLRVLSTGFQEFVLGFSFWWALGRILSL